MGCRLKMKKKKKWYKKLYKRTNLKSPVSRNIVKRKM